VCLLFIDSRVSKKSVIYPLSKIYSPGKVDQSLPKSVSNFIALGQKMYERRVTIFYTLQYFGAPGDPLWPLFSNLGAGVQQVPDYHCAKFRPLLTTCLRVICCRTSFILLKAWPTDSMTDKKTLKDMSSPYHVGTVSVGLQPDIGIAINYYALF